MNSLGTAFLGLLILQIATAALEAQPVSSSPTPTPTIFDPRPLGVIPLPTEPPPRAFPHDEESKPIPRKYLVTGAVAAALAAAGILYGASRAWRSSNLFDRQYRFPAEPAPALRFGGQKSGGHMANVRFRLRSARRSSGLKSKDA